MRFHTSLNLILWKIGTCLSNIIDAVVFNTLRPRQDGHHFPEDILRYIFLNKNVWILLAISLKCVWEVRINNIPSLVQIMAWRRPGDKPLSAPMMASLLTHICVTQPQWVNDLAIQTLSLTLNSVECIFIIVIFILFDKHESNLQSIIHILLICNTISRCRDHFVYAPSQWETMLNCNIVSYWLDGYTKWSLRCKFIFI